jgi:hypothetical protein
MLKLAMVGVPVAPAPLAVAVWVLRCCTCAACAVAMHPARTTAATNIARSDVAIRHPLRNVAARAI